MVNGLDHVNNQTWKLALSQPIPPRPAHDNKDGVVALHRMVDFAYVPINLSQLLAQLAVVCKATTP
jgi:hypothetical protein